MMTEPPQHETATAAQPPAPPLCPPAAAPSDADRPLTRYERRSLRVQWLIFLATAIYACVATWQLLTMRSTLIATQTSADAARVSAEAARAQADAATIAATAAARANEIASDSLKLSYRARVFFSVPPLERPDVSGNKLRWEVEYVNLGRGAASQIWTFVTIATSKSPDAPRSLIPRGLAETYTKQALPIFQPLGPGKKDRVRGDDFPIFGSELRDSVLIQGEALTIQALVYYRDEFGDAHESSVCVTYTDANSARFCPAGNYSD